MANDIALAYSIGANAMGSAANAYSTRVNAKANYAIGQFNAEQQDMAADNIIRNAIYGVRDVRVEAGRVRAVQRVSLAASGVALDSDVAGAIDASTVALSEGDVAAINTGARFEAFQMREAARQTRANASVQRVAAKDAENTQWYVTAGQAALVAAAIYFA